LTQVVINKNKTGDYRKLLLARCIFIFSLCTVKKRLFTVNNLSHDVSYSYALSW